LLDIAGELGLDLDDLLAPLRLTPTYMSQPEARLTPEQGRALVRRVRGLTGRTEIGLLMAERIRVADFDLLGYVMRSAETLLSGLEAIVRYGRLVGDSAAFDLERAGEKVVLRLGLAGGEQFEPEGADGAAGITCRLIAELSGGTVLPLEVHLPRQRPSCAVFYRKWFQAPVLFGADGVQLVYAAQSLALAPPQSDLRLSQLLARQAGSILDTLPPSHGLLDRVRGEIRRSLSDGTLSLRRIARRCGLSERTLRRRLQDEGYRFREVVEDLRREQALFLIRAGNHEVAAIALQLGYRDPTSFARAFRRWTGATPQAYLSRQG
jgi:AraC-like DNA-binding protein